MVMFNPLAHIGASPSRLSGGFGAASSCAVRASSRRRPPRTGRDSDHVRYRLTTRHGRQASTCRARAAGDARVLVRDGGPQ